jgi:hypothetical protein
VTARTGLGIVDIAVLETLERIAARSDRPYVKSAKAVVDLDEVYGLAPELAYMSLCDMARPWVVPVRCVDFHGNLGSPDFPEAGPRYTEARLSRIGGLALAAERGEVGAVPIGLINGNTHGGGTRPPFAPRRMIAALGRLVSDPSIRDSDLADIVGPPAFPMGCEVGGDIAALMAGEAVSLELSARLRPVEPPGRGWIVDRVPPGVGSRDISDFVMQSVHSRPWAVDLPELDRRTRFALSGLDYLSQGDGICLVFTAADGADLDELRDRLLRVHGISVEVRAQLPAPLGGMLRIWVAAHATDDLRDSLGRLDELLD